MAGSYSAHAPLIRSLLQFTPCAHNLGRQPRTRRPSCLIPLCLIMGHAFQNRTTCCPALYCNFRANGKSIWNHISYPGRYPLHSVTFTRAGFQQATSGSSMNHQVPCDNLCYIDDTRSGWSCACFVAHGAGDTDYGTRNALRYTARQQRCEFISKSSLRP
jgi:hypothetical protein